MKGKLVKRKVKFFLGILVLLALSIIGYLYCASQCRYFPADKFSGIIETIDDENKLQVWKQLKRERLLRIHVNVTGLDYSVYHFTTTRSSKEILSYFFEFGCTLKSQTDHPEIEAIEIELNCNHKGKDYLTIVYDPLNKISTVSYEKLSSKYSFSNMCQCCFYKP